MSSRGICLAVIVAAGLAMAGEEPKVMSFAKGDLGKVPAGWKTDKTGKGEGSVWKVVEDKTAPSKTGYALAQTAESPKNMYNLCVAEKSNCKDVEIKVSFKANKGDIDQGGGIVWRYQDADNYYIARMNPLEENYRLYHVIAGVRTQLVSKDALVVPAGTWHTLTIKHVGDTIECWLDGKKQIDAKDSKITKAGKIGLWTKADAQTSFDDIRVTGLDK